jgi:predicted dehydrogenase
MSRPSTRRLEVFCEDALLWADDDYLGPVHVETSAGSEVIPGQAPPWVDRFRLPSDLATQLAQYAAPTKSFLDALGLDALGAGSPAGGFPDAAVALAAHRVVDAAYRSEAAGGAPIGLA